MNVCMVNVSARAYARVHLCEIWVGVKYERKKILGIKKRSENMEVCDWEFKDFVNLW